MLPRLLVPAAMAVALTSAIFGEVPERFFGTWVVEGEATARTIADDPNMAPENKAGWTKRWIESGVEVQITESLVSFHGLEPRPINISVALEEDSTDRTLLSAVITDPHRKEEIEASIALRLGEAGDLNVQIRPGNDFDLVIWKRTNGLAAESGTRAPGDLIAYLDNLKTCTPGKFQFSYPGFGTYLNTILGQQDNGCQVRIEPPKIKLLCSYSDKTIALLTSSAKYEDARQGVLSGSTDSEESRRVADECSPE